MPLRLRFLFLVAAAVGFGLLLVATTAEQALAGALLTILGTGLSIAD
jgi:hypothetical protein